MKLLKNLRQKFITNKRLNNYAFYAVGEVTLLVIGILIALYFSNLNVKNSNTKKEIWYLDNIANDMFYQKQALLENNINCEYYLLATEELIIQYNQDQAFLNMDSLSIGLNQLMTPLSYPNINNTYSELLSSGQVFLIENEDVLIDIIDFYLHIKEENAMFSAYRNEEFYRLISPVFYKYTQVSIQNTDKKEQLNTNDNSIDLYIQNTLKNPKHKLELVNALKNYWVILTNQKEILDFRLKECDKMIKMIDKEIARLNS